MEDKLFYLQISVYKNGQLNSSRILYGINTLNLEYYSIQFDFK